jgi:hypothetical protein
VAIVVAATGAATALRADDLRSDPHALERAAAAGLVIAVDQLEELFTLCDDDLDRRCFLDALLAAWDDPSSPVAVIVAPRADFYGRIADHPGLSAAIIVDQSLLTVAAAYDGRTGAEDLTGGDLGFMSSATRCSGPVQEVLTWQLCVGTRPVSSTPCRAR